jgi:hypothetical protein
LDAIDMAVDMEMADNTAKPGDDHVRTKEGEKFSLSHVVLRGVNGLVRLDKNRYKAN